MTLMSDLIIAANLFLSFLLGGLIGWFREKEGKTAGMRTHILVSLGSALLMVLSIKMVEFGASDPGRIAAGVVTGIGFLGAGCIVQTGSGVTGITTAASIWITAAIGMACGGGFYFSALVASLLTITALQGLREMEIRVIKTKKLLPRTAPSLICLFFFKLIKLFYYVLRPSFFIAPSRPIVCWLLAVEG